MKKVVEFLTQLEHNNNREWFTENKESYEEARLEFLNFTELLLLKTKELDNKIDDFEAKKCVYRIYRDARFSKNKAPYKNNMGAVFAPGGRKSPFAGYYFHLQPGASFAGGGIYMPMPAVLKEIRHAIFDEPEELRAIISAPKFISTFGEMHPNKLKTAPRGFPKDFHEVDLLRYKSYTSVQEITDQELFSSTLIEKIITVFKAQKQLNDYLNSIIENMDKTLLDQPCKY